jgi:hypothetical protein
MPTTTTRKTGRVRWISHKEMDAIVEKRTQAVLNVSPATFARNRKNGEYAKLDADDCPGIIELALLAPSVEVAKSGARKKR